MTARTGLRVAVATPSYPPEVGGLGVLVRNLATALAGQGCDATVLTQTRDRAPRPAEPGAAVRVLAFRSAVGGRRFGYAPRLRRHVLDHRGEFDVVHAFSYHAPVALAVSGVTGSPLLFSPVFHAGGHSALARAAHVGYRPVARRVFERAEAILCLSSAERDDVVRLYPFCARWARVVPIAVDAEQYAGVEPFEVARPVILSAGRLDRYKRVDAVVRAMGALGDRATLVVTGVGPELEPLRRLVAELGLSGTVQVLGGVEEVTLHRWQRTAAVVVSISSRESFGLAVAEGIVAGAAIVASEIPAHREVAAALDASPVYVPADVTTGDLASALRAALDAGRPGPMSKVPRAWSDVARDTIAVYEDALAHPRARS